MNYSTKLFGCMLAIFFFVPMPVHSEVFTPDSFLDQVDSNIGDGLCRTAAGDCTLRAAIQEANETTGPHEIRLSSGFYLLTLLPAPIADPQQNAINMSLDENEAALNDLDIKTHITITGQGAAKTTIDGNRIGRVFDIRPPEDTPNLTLTVTLNDLSITGGEVSVVDENAQGGPAPAPGGLGGGILVSGGALTLNDVWVYGNTAMGVGGGIFAVGSTLSLNHTLIYNNKSSSGGGISAMTGRTYIDNSFILFSDTTNTATAFLGGGIFNFGELIITNSVLHGNRAEIDGGAIYHGLGKLRITNSTLTSNYARRNGGALYYRMGEIGFRSSIVAGEPVLRNVSIVNNVATATDLSLRPGARFSDYVSSAVSFSFNSATPTEIIEGITLDVPEGDSEGALGGGGVVVTGQFGQGQAKVGFPIVNTIIAGNFRNTRRTVPDDCKTTLDDGEIVSLGFNADGDDSCNFGHTNDLAPGLDLRLETLDINSIIRPGIGSFSPNLTQNAFNKLRPHIQLFSPGSPLLDAANSAQCPDDDQIGQSRARLVNGCDIGAYEFLPPVASSMQFVAKPGDVIRSIFVASAPAEKTLTYEIVSVATQGTVTQPNGASQNDWSYTANGTASNSDQFTFRACFSTGECSNEGTIAITIISDPIVTEVVSIDILSDVAAGSASEIDIVNEADFIAGLEDTDYTFPVGAMFFSIEDIPIDNAPDSIVVELQLPLDMEIPADAVVRKLDNSGVWRTLASSPSASESTGIIDVVEKTITLTLLDNDVFDSNPIVGVIRDPVALGIPDVPPNSKAVKSEKSGGAFNIQLLLLLLVGGLSLRFFRQK